MLPYILLSIFTLLTYGVGCELAKRHQSGEYYFKIISIIMLVIFAATRGIDVGTDTRGYLHMWSAIIHTPFEDLTILSEPLFSFYSYITYILSTYLDVDYWLFLLGISTVTVLAYVNSIEKYSTYKTQSLFIFIALGIYTFHFNGVRQAITMAIFLFSYRFIISGELKKYLLLLFCAFLIHKSIIVMLPFYWFFRMGLTKNSVMLIVFCSILASLAMQQVVDFASEFDERYSSYADARFAGGGLVSVLFYTSILLWLSFCMKVNNLHTQLYKHSLLAMFVSVCIGWVSIILSLNPSGILRLIMYFTQFSIFSIPISIMSFRPGIQRLFIAISVYTVLFLYFYITTSFFSGLSPYKSVLEIPL